MMKKLNIGLNYCKGKYIARMDADDLSLPNRFKLQLEVFNRKPDLAVAGSMAEAFDSNGHKVRASYFPTNYEAIRFTSMGKSPLIHVWTMIRKDYLEEFNGYNESFLIAADYDLWSRFLIKGYKIVVLKQKCVKCHRSNLTYSARNILIKNDEKPLIAKRNICFFTGLKVEDNLAKDITKLYEGTTKCNLKEFYNMYKSWKYIKKHYRYNSYVRFQYAYIVDLLIIIIKYLRANLINLYV